MAVELPEPDRTLLARSPITSVVCQVRYEPNLRASQADVALAVQDALGGREGRYPKLDQLSELSVNIAMIGGAPPAATQQQGIGWKISSDDDAYAVTLTPTHVSLEAARYEGWAEDFSGRLRELLAAASTHIQPVLEQRLGLRYINQITEPEIREGTGWQEWIAAPVLGLASDPLLADAVTLMRHQDVLRLDDEAVCTFTHGYAPDQSRENALTFLIDLDVSRQGNRPFDIESLMTAAERFNTYALALFQRATTEALRQRFAQP